MEFESYEFGTLEPQVMEFWDEKEIHAAANAQNAAGEPFYFLDGPPYTSGKVHIGTAWNKSMKDMVCRYRRMQGRKVWDRAGYDMHGLPNEHGAMEDLGLADKDAILAYGLDRFIRACKDRAVRNLETMNDDFRRLGVWMDFENAYQTISEEWLESVWWLVKTAHEKGRLYEGLRPMAWDPVHESACAKHELFYKSVEDESIYVAFKRRDADEYFVVWTTTPWTIPLNLMIMVNPEVSYARVKTSRGILIIAEECVERVLEAAQLEGDILETFPGSQLVDARYDHFLADIMDFDSLDAEDLHRVVASTEYVTTESGSGLVHAAPGCGPEDYEVGVREDIPAYNVLDEQGRFPEDLDLFGGKRARIDDASFTDVFEERGALIARQPYVHDYPHAERSKAPVVYKTTKQWFFRVDDRKEEMIAANQDVHWTPEAGFNAFNNWLENLRDNSITKQRFWGTPFPVWRNEDDPDDVIIVGSRQELEALSGQSPEDLHLPFIDEVVIEREGKTYRRIPDVIDVWVDAGVASFACLRYPHSEEAFEEFFPADFIIEGNDQVRGWFNLLMVASTLAFDEAPFRNVYMHGMIQDAKGRKMSKSEGNYIRPEEVVGRFGADACRLYWIGGTKAGQDLNYNMDDCEIRYRNLRVYWNIHKYLLDLAAQTDTDDLSLPDSFTFEDAYILSVTHRTIKEVEDRMSWYEIDRVPGLVEDLLGEISRTYIQHVRSRAGGEDAHAVLAVLAHCFSAALRLLAPICPFITDAMWQNLRSLYGDEAGSVHLLRIPIHSDAFIDADLEAEMRDAQRVITAILAARDRSQIGVRWPLSEARISGVSLSERSQRLVAEHTNVRSLAFPEDLDLSFVVEPDYRAIGKEYGERTADIAQAIKDDQDRIAEEFKRTGSITAAGEKLEESFLDVTATAPDGFTLGEDQQLRVLLDIRQDEDLLREGFFRELVRRIQQLRKEGDLDKTDAITLHVDESLADIVEDRQDELMQLVGASSVSLDPEIAAPHMAEHQINDRTLRFGFFLEA